MPGPGPKGAARLTDVDGRRLIAALRKEVLQQFVAALGGNRFRMELHALDRQRPVPQPHDLAVGGPGGDLEALGQRLALDCQRVIAGGGERARQAGEHADARVLDGGGLAVHQRPGSDHPAAERVADCLVAEADAEDRHPAAEAADHLERDAGLGRRARPGRDADAVRLRARAISSQVISSLRKTRTCSPSSPKYCTRL
jgi:hypothetical protein